VRLPHIAPFFLFMSLVFELSGVEVGKLVAVAFRLFNFSQGVLTLIYRNVLLALEYGRYLQVCARGARIVSVNHRILHVPFFIRS